MLNAHTREARTQRPWLTRKARVVVLATLASLSVVACGDTAPEPSASLVAAAAPSASEANTYEAFCAILLRVRERDDSLSPLTDAMAAKLSVAETPDDPEALAAVHAWGQALLEFVDPSNAAYEEAKTLIDDAELIAGLDLTIRLNNEFTIPFAQATTQTQDLEEFTQMLTQFTKDTSAAMSPQDTEAIFALNDFSLSECGFTLREQ